MSRTRAATGRQRERSTLLDKLAGELRGYQSAYDAFDEAIATRLRINRTDLRCIDLISQHQPITAGELAHLAGLTSGAVTFVLDRLERAGFLRRARGTADRRQVLVELIAEQHERIFSLHLPLIAEFRRAVARFGLEDLEVILDFLSVARRAYEHVVPMVHLGSEDEGAASVAPDAEDP